MIELYQFPRAWGEINPSPFCMKTEVYLKLAGIPHQVKTAYNPRKAPKRRFPFIKDGSTVLGDSSFIIDYLEKKFGGKLDARLTGEQKAVAYVARRTFEEHFINIFLYQRWMDESNWPMTKEIYFGKLPAPLRMVIPELIRREMKKRLRLVGLLSHSREEIYEIGRKDLAVFSSLLGEKPFFMGSEPTSLDATAFAFLANLLRAPLAGPLKEAALSHKNLVDYVDRMEKRVFVR